MSKTRRVAVTGLGALTAIGKSAPEFWNGLVSGQSGAVAIDRFDTTNFPTKFACQIQDFDPSEVIAKKDARRMDLFSQYALVTADEAVKDAAIDVDQMDKDRVAVLIGSGIGGMQNFYDQSVNFYEKGIKGVSPFFIPMLIPDMAAGHVSMRFGFRGPSYCAVSACATGSHNIGLAFDHIKNGQADFAIAGGAEAPIMVMGVSGFNNLKAMSTNNDEFETASRPFDKRRDGFVLGEGAGMLFLEEMEHAKARGARIYAELVGYGFSSDAYHMTAPDPSGEGVILAMKAALEAADIRPDQVDHINMHGTATPLGDAAESNAIKKVFGDHAYKMNLNSTKSMTGHTLGAAGAIESIASALAVYHGIVPPTINFKEADPDCDLNYTFNEAHYRDVRYAINNAFGFGGKNTSVVFKKFEDA